MRQRRQLKLCVTYSLVSNEKVLGANWTQTRGNPGTVIIYSNAASRLIGDPLQVLVHSASRIPPRFPVDRLLLVLHATSVTWSPSNNPFENLFTEYQRHIDPSPNNSEKRRPLNISIRINGSEFINPRLDLMAVNAGRTIRLRDIFQCNCMRESIREYQETVTVGKFKCLHVLHDMEVHDMDNTKLFTYCLEKVN